MAGYFEKMGIIIFTLDLHYIINKNLILSNWIEENMASTMRKYYAASFLGGLSFTNGILILYYRNIGFSYSQIFLLSIVYEILTFVLEIPSGILADLWSRKWVVVIGHALSGLSFLIVLIAPTFFPVFLLWSVLSAICTALNSGTLTALIFDTLKENGEDQQFYKVQSNITILTLLAQTISIILGGWIADSWGFTYTLLFSAVSGLLLTALFMTVQDTPSFYNPTNEENGHPKDNALGKFLRHFKRSLSFMTANKTFLVLSILGVSGFVTIAVFNTTLQPLIATTGITSYLQVSIVIALFNLCSMVLIYLTRNKTDGFTKRQDLLFSLFLIAVLFLGIGLVHSTGMLFLLLLLNSLLEIYQLIINNQMNHLIPSDTRATILSTQNQLNSLVYSLIAMLIGESLDKFGLSRINLIFAVCFAILAFIFWMRMKRNDTKTIPN